MWPALAALPTILWHQWCSEKIYEYPDNQSKFAGSDDEMGHTIRYSRRRAVVIDKAMERGARYTQQAITGYLKDDDPYTETERLHPLLGWKS